MNRVTEFSAALLLTLGLHGCATNCGLEPEPCAPQPLIISSLETEYGCSDTRFLNSQPLESAVVIRTQADFDRRVSGECHPQIDFTRFDLVIGQQQMSGSSSSSVTYSYQFTCPAKERVLRVMLKPGLTADFGFRSYHALVPKLGPTETVRVEVEVTP
ncbi:hypothetical protein KLP40_11765 [Hymenobacter sp. NST-14]|uniref:hypothetical protein n=1 Tax=Hymenobacter piscis TaxID=2839984 RepID=UPI001C0131E0|nr:hypothetical protein [Hymenobacter piscis]MBT9393840.1 hypothetical protein [Hymenobacter piscis]